MNSSQVRSLLCSAFEISEEGGSFLIHTPFAVDFNDDLVIRLRPVDNGFRIDDNGETILSLALAGSAPDFDRVNELVPNVNVDELDGAIHLIERSPAKVVHAIYSVIAASLRIHGAYRPRTISEPSDFRERVVAALEDVAREFSLPISFDQTVEQAGNLTADVVLGEKHKFLVIAASSVERLMEAELIYLRRQLSKQGGFVCAAVPSAKAIGLKHFSRANYYTDKTVEFDGWSTAFMDLARQHAMH